MDSEIRTLDTCEIKTMGDLRAFAADKDIHDETELMIYGDLDENGKLPRIGLAQYLTIRPTPYGVRRYLVFVAVDQHE